jgi:cold shock CspA family protein
MGRTAREATELFKTDYLLTPSIKQEAKTVQRREGTVIWFKDEKGYGRIMLGGQDGNHVFVHFSGFRPDPVRFPNGFSFLKEGQ